ncbi:PTS system ascorbate-specific IIA component [Thermosporothrix hazakensis]|jgi:mannitol/fructose-specific phosphotransferase system IIA component (Ntr-type)|uniref:Ascorbate-specific PTS system EIIA component n=1 Tax=Thermosporothrix hazakensis TaxID=644383 RepID=A0A326U9Y8_THEHA|nr:PTS sugar transporter subunit IIA [Thermosporothrix hazakensis]PZW32023.1 PTS system ascorbate-specific IIA component [Thermosporothrix hazakensis]GCE49649.1 hypothetical protein KTH_45180 [Thermosporothrix hazakensis]
MQLDHLLTKETIRLQVRATGRMDVVQKAGELLVASGNADARYIEAMKHSLKTHGPYMVIVPGVALLHARPEDGVRQLCMSLVTLDPPIEFGNPDNDPVSVAFALGAEDNSKHVEAIAVLAGLLEDEQAMETIRHSTSVDEVLQIIAAAQAGE